MNSSYILYTLFLMFIFVGLSTGWNIIGGLAGQVSIGHSLFFGIGAYSTAVLWLAGYHPILGTVLGAILSTLLALILTPTFRLRGIYFAVGTLFMNEVVKQIFINWNEVGDGVGLYLPIPTVFLLEPFYYASLTYSLMVLVIAYLIGRSRLGLTLTAIREDETAASVIGVKILRYKVVALMISAVIFAIGGGVYTSYQTYIEPHSMFSLEWGISPLFMTILGGVGTLMGPVIGAVVYTLIGQSVAILANIRLLTFAIVIIIVVRFMPKGLTGYWRHLVRVVKSQKAMPR
ncbi:MAG: branched-chain amino acid ABC transporter permease [Candidatus Caldarchaeum sp.]